MVEEVIAPALAAGKMVVSDRFLLANLVYQGYAGGLDVEGLRVIGRTATTGIEPALTFVLDVPDDVAIGRLNRPLDRMEQQGAAFRAACEKDIWPKPRGNPSESWSSTPLAASTPCKPKSAPRPSGSLNRHDLTADERRMSWQGIAGHDEIVEQFRRALRAGALPARSCLSVPKASASARSPCGWRSACSARRGRPNGSTRATNAPVVASAGRHAS